MVTVAAEDGLASSVLQARLRELDAFVFRAAKPTEALKHAVVYHCTRLISGALAQVQWRIRPGKGRKVGPPNLEHLLNVAPHQRWTGPALKEWIGMGILLRGNAYVRIVRGGNDEVVRLVPLPWESVTPLVTGGADGELVYRVCERGQRTALHSADVIDVPNFGWDGVRAPSVLSSGALGALAISRDLERFTGIFFRRGSLHRFLVKVRRRQSPREWKRFRARWKRGSRGVDAADEPLFVPDGLDVTPISLTNEDAQLLANREFQITDALRAFGVPSALGNQEAKNTSFGSGLASLLHGFARYTLAPHVERVEAELNAKLAPTDGSWRIDLDMSGLLRATLKEQLEAMKLAVEGRLLTPNEARTFLGYGAVEGADALNHRAQPTKATQQMMQLLVDAGVLKQSEVSILLDAA